MKINLMLNNDGTYSVEMIDHYYSKRFNQYMVKDKMVLICDHLHLKANLENALHVFNSLEQVRLKREERQKLNDIGQEF